MSATAELSASQQAATRAARNTFVRAVGEIVGKLASLVLVFVLAREVGAHGLGVYVFALAWAEVALTPVDMGFDRYMLRVVARDHAAADKLLWNVLAAKFLRAVPILTVSSVLAVVLTDGATQHEAIWLATLALLFNSFTWTLLSLFNAHERGELGALTIVAQRVLSAGLGIAALAAGMGVVSVMAAFAAGMALAVVVSIALAARRIGLPRIDLDKDARRELRRESWPFAGQELLSIGIARADTLLLGLLATTTVVGLYGAGYRLFESTLFIPLALTGAFSAMFAYLEADSEPSVHDVFQRSIKLTLFLLIPIGVTFGVLAAPLTDAFFGDAFGGAAAPLRLLAPTAVLLGVVLVSTSLVVSRTNPRRMVWVFGIALVVNVAANLVLIPWLDQSGAALAMLLTEAVFAVIVLRMAAQAVGRLSAPLTLTAPVVAGAVMAAPMLALDFSLWLAIPAGAIAYLAAFWLVESRVAPGDLAFVRELVARRLKRA